MGDLVAVLAEPNRRRLLELLVGGERTVGDLATHFGVTRSAVSQHLRVLADAGLVESRREGRFRHYHLIPEGMAALRASLDVFWSRELDELATATAPVVPRKGVSAMALEKSVVVPLGPDDTFALLTEPDRLRRWQVITARIDLRAGGDYRWTVVPGHNAAGTVQEVDPGKRVVFTWGWQDTTDLPPGASTVTITLEPVDGGTLVRLVHEGLTDEQAERHAEGWEHFLGRLVEAARTGDAGPDEWVGGDSFDRLSAAEASLAVCQVVLRRLGHGDDTAPTPCAKFTVADVVDHLVGSLTHLGTMAGMPEGPLPTGPAEARVAGVSQRALEAWRLRGIEGTVPFGSGEMPAAVAADILSLELLVHAWDVAEATGQTIEVSDALSGFVLERGREVIQPGARDGDRFGPEVAVGPDADNLRRLAAFTGRPVT